MKQHPGEIFHNCRSIDVRRCWSPVQTRGDGRAARLLIAVTFDPGRGTTVDGVPLSALSLSGLRRRLEDAHRGEDIEIKPILDKRARFERDQRRRGGGTRIGDYAGVR